MLTAETQKAPPTVSSFQIITSRQIAAPIDIVFEMVLTPQGRFSEMNLKLERWVGGRWFRDLGNNSGHLWGHVQVIKPPKLLEIIGPMAMSYAVASHIQYRLTEQDGGTLLKLTHQAVGAILPEHSEGFNKGWDELLDNIKSVSEKGAAKR